MKILFLLHSYVKVKKIFRIRYVAILVLGYITVQLVLLYLNKGRCETEICTSGNGSSLLLFFPWNGFFKKTEHTLPPCPLQPPDLRGEIKPDKSVLTWAELESKFLNLHSGGRYKPVNCTSWHRVAIIVPFRDRDIHLKIFLNNIHPILQRQQLDYGVYIVDLAPSVSFNRALLLNVGVLESLKVHDYDCFIFHDVDLIPENDRIMYSCSQHPRHMSVAVDIMKYKLPYDKIFGGVVGMSKEHIYAVNGYSNRYFGWGGEDDDMFNRFNASNLTLARYPADIARYTMLKHVRQEENLARFDILKSGKETFKSDGINTLKYERLTMQFRRLFTYILVNVNQTEIESGLGIRYNVEVTSD